MGKKMNLSSIFKNKETRHPWQWPSCKHPKTLSFRAGDDMIKTVNSIYFDPASDGPETPESCWFTNSSVSTSFSAKSEEILSAGGGGDQSVEVVIRGVQSERLFFEPGGTNSILEEAKAGVPRFRESVVMSMDSEDPYTDFRRSMEEMVESCGLKDWECLEELLGWYLRVNGKVNHGIIVGAFVDLLVGLGSSASDSTSFSSAASSFSSPNSSPLSGIGQKEINEEDKMVLIS